MNSDEFFRESPFIEDGIANLHQLLMRPPPALGEGPAGYLLRLAEANWLTFAQLRRLGVRYTVASLSSHGLLPGISEVPDLHDQVERVDRLMRDEHLIWNHRYARFCPRCLVERGRWRIEWETLFFDACPDHGLWLVDRCCSCAVPITWNRDVLLRCRCGSDLRAEAAQPCPDNVASLMRILEGKVRGCCPDNTPEPIRIPNLKRTHRIIKFLGAHLDPAAGKRPMKIIEAGSMSASWPVTSLAAEILMRWPQAMYESLDHIQKHGGSAGGSARALGGVFGAAYHYLFRVMKSPDFVPLRDALAEWIKTSWKGALGRRNRGLAEHIVAKADWIPSNVARDYLQVSERRLRTLVGQGLIEGDESVSAAGRRFLMVRRDQLDDLKSCLAEEMDMKAVASRLGLCKKRMGAVLRLIFPTAHKATNAELSPWVVRRQEVEHLVALADGLPRVAIPDEDSVSLAHLLRYWSWSPPDVTVFIQAVQRREMAPYAYLEGARGITGWIFREFELKIWYQQHNQGFGIWFSITNAGATLGIKPKSVTQLVLKQFILAERISITRGGRSRIHRDEIDRFLRTYAISAKVAEQLGTKSRWLIRDLEKRSIFAISGARIDGCDQVLFLRTEEFEKAISEMAGERRVELRLDYSRKQGT